MSDVPKSHPRYLSLALRDKIVEGVTLGITSIHGLIAHGRGEAFDYLLSEQTHVFAKNAVRAAAAMLCLAKHPVISVNGNVAALAPEDIVELAALLNAPLEVNIFHTESGREEKIRQHLLKHGAEQVLMPTTDAQLPYIDSNRKYVNPDGIMLADVVFVPLEDGDRCEALRKMGKEVVTIDLNPMSRTAQTASITVVDNVIRAIPLLCAEIQKKPTNTKMQSVLNQYHNETILSEALHHIRRGAND